jgi:hypothetical protein
MKHKPYASGVRKKDGRSCVLYAPVGVRIYKVYRIHKELHKIKLLDGINLLGIL